MYIYLKSMLYLDIVVFDPLKSLSFSRIESRQAFLVRRKKPVMQTYLVSFTFTHRHFRQPFFKLRIVLATCPCFAYLGQKPLKENTNLEIVRWSVCGVNWICENPKLYALLLFLQNGIFLCGSWKKLIAFAIRKSSNKRRSHNFKALTFTTILGRVGKKWISQFDYRWSRKDWIEFKCDLNCTNVCGRKSYALILAYKYFIRCIDGSEWIS